MNEFSFNIEIFEGPLDLLLHLVQKNKVSIYDIPIAKITEQYFEYLEKLQNLDMELSGEFIVMASQLLLIKSKMLLPTHDEDEEDPRQELQNALEEYKRYKTVATEFDVLLHAMDEVIFKDAENLNLPKLPPENPNMSPNLLLAAFSDILYRNEVKKPLSPETFRSVVGRKRVSVRTKCRYILGMFTKKKEIAFTNIFDEMDDRGEIVATFLALLTLVHENKIKVESKGKNILCTKVSEGYGTDTENIG